MKRIDLIEKTLAKLSMEHGVTAGELAANLGLSRANVSNDLNRLCDEGKAEKEGSKPVYYRIAAAAVQQNAEYFLNVFMQDNPSLFHCVEQAKAAVLYPPHGMHMLLFGETGVGKSMFAEMIYRYAHENGFLSGTAPFVVFNCADYTDNPQLLVSQLMGTKKGAFTGADADRPGLLEKADGGILFLDEVHRLPPQGQEMLFTFIDKGTYRRLGETEADRKASVLLICATTEDPDSNLLKTFIRRIPMILKIPNLSERSMDERLNLISRFFMDESARLGNPISVSVNSMRSLLSYHCPNNVGQLKSDIQIICAKAYFDYISGIKSELCVVSMDLPDYIREGLTMETSHRKIWSRFVGINQRFCVFDSKLEAPLKNEEGNESIYDIIDSRMQELKNTETDQEKITEKINQDIQLYFEKYSRISDWTEDFSSIRNLVGMNVICMVDKIISYAEEKLMRSYGNSVRYGLSVHIYSSISRIRRGQKIINPQLNSIRKTLPQEFSVALEGLKIIKEQIGIEIPIDEAGFLAVFFDLSHFHHSERVQVVVIAHGTSTATSLAEAANRLLGMNYAAGINASLDESPQKVYLRLKEYLSDHSPTSSLLLLVDMGSLMNFPAELEKELGIQAKAIPLVSTLHVMEAVRKASLGYPLEYVYQETLRVDELLYESRSSIPIKEQLAKMFIVTVCTTGEGSAALIKNVLDGQLNYCDSLCETIALKLTDRNDIINRLSAIRQIGRVLCVVSTFYIDFSAPHFTLADVLEGHAIPKIQELIDQEAMFEKIGQTFSTMLENGDSRKILNYVRQVVTDIEVKSGMKLKPDVLVGVFCHLGCMVDRLLGKQSVTEFPHKESFMQENQSLLSVVRTACEPLQAAFSISIPDDEICYTATFFTSENCEINLSVK